MSNTLICPDCDYCLQGDEPSVFKQCNICRLVHQVSKLSVKDLFHFVDQLKLIEDQSKYYTYSGIKQRINFKEGL